jgi:hypothetical protein
MLFEVGFGPGLDVVSLTPITTMSQMLTATHLVGRARHCPYRGPGDHTDYQISQVGSRTRPLLHRGQPRLLGTWDTFGDENHCRSPRIHARNACSPEATRNYCDQFRRPSFCARDADHLDSYHRFWPCFSLCAAINYYEPHHCNAAIFLDLVERSLDVILIEFGDDYMFCLR